MTSLLATEETQWVESTDGVRLPVTRYAGARSGATILIGHATGFHGRVYDPLVEALDGFEIVTADLRGHGDAQSPPELDLSWESFGYDLHRVAGSLNTGPIDSPAEAGSNRPLLGFGHSMGAACLLMVEQNAPGTFSAMFCYEPVIHPPESRDQVASGPEGPPRIERWIERTKKRRALFESRDAAHSNYSSKPPYEGFDARALDAYIDHGFSVDDHGVLHLKCRPEVEAQIYRLGPRHRTWDRLFEVQCPVLVARGSVVQSGPSSWADRIAAELPRGELEVFQGLGHLGPLEEPKTVGERVAHYFRDWEACAAGN